MKIPKLSIKFVECSPKFLLSHEFLSLICTPTLKMDNWNTVSDVYEQKVEAPGVNDTDVLFVYPSNTGNLEIDLKNMSNYTNLLRIINDENGVIKAYCSETPDTDVHIKIYRRKTVNILEWHLKYKKIVMKKGYYDGEYNEIDE